MRGNASRDADRGVSPVIGVILMVAITVILAAVVGTFVLGLVDDLDSTARAGVTFYQINETAVDVTLMTLGNVHDPSAITFNEPCSGDPGSFAAVGDTVTITGCAPGDRISVVGSLGGRETVIVTYTMR